MKKAIVVGGSNGIGLTLVNKLIATGRHVIIVDMYEPKDLSQCESWSFIKTNLVRFDSNLFDKLANEDADTLFITAGFGRICNFEDLCETEIEKLFNVNAISVAKILSTFYKKIKSNNEFYTGVMGSIAGLVSSPMFSVYSATKASVCKLIEAINIELEANGYANRILNVSPGSINGTKFNGGENDLSLTETLANEILNSLFKKEVLLIPDYDKTYKGVIDRYNTDAHSFGLESYEYKKNSGRASKSKMVLGYLSGTFDLFHVGHLNLIRRAKDECDYLIVGVHPDASHKGKQTIISFEDRMGILAGCKYINEVVQAPDHDDDAWDVFHYDKLFVGSDYKGTERFKRYEKYFEDKNVEIIYFPYTQSICSTQIRQKIAEKKEEKWIINH